MPRRTAYGLCSCFSCRTQALSRMLQGPDPPEVCLQGKLLAVAVWAHGRVYQSCKARVSRGWVLSLTDSELTFLGCRVHCECLGDTQEPAGGPVQWAECAPPTDGQGEPSCLRSISSLFLSPIFLLLPLHFLFRFLSSLFPSFFSLPPLLLFPSALLPSRSLLSSFLDDPAIHCSKLMTNKAVRNTEPFRPTFQLGKNH